MPKVILVRIAQTESNATGKLSGRREDSPLTRQGKAMADYVADLLSKIAPTAIYSGPAQRCQETAQYTAQRLDLPVMVYEEFQESIWVFSMGRAGKKSAVTMWDASS